MTNPTVFFCGSPEFACPSLEGLCQLNNKLTLHVVSQPDKRRSRRGSNTATPVKALARSKKLPVYTPTNQSEFTSTVATIQPDLIIVIAYGMILPASIVTRFPCINAHASLLPRYRGASPIQASLLNNDTESGITLIQLVKEMDAGPILMQQRLLLDASETGQTLHDKLSLMASRCLQAYMTQFLQHNTITATEQDHQQATYCQKIKPTDLYLNPTDSPAINLAKIKAFSPKPGAFSWYKKKRVKIIDAIINGGILQPTIVCPEGKPPMSYTAFTRGYHDAKLEIVC